MTEFSRLTGEKLRPHHQEIVEFAQAIVDGTPSPVPPEQSLQAQADLGSPLPKRETGREVVIPPA